MTLTDQINQFVNKYSYGVFDIVLGGGLGISGFISAWPQNPETLDSFLYNIWGYGGAALALYGLSSIADNIFKERYGCSIWDTEIGFKRK